MKNLGKIWGFLLVLMFTIVLPAGFLSVAHASDNQNFFSFDLKSYVMDYFGGLDINFKFEMPVELQERFILKPKVLSGNVDFVEEVDESSESVEVEEAEARGFWTSFPKLSKEFKIKAEGNFESTDIWFEVLDTKTGEIYETRKKTIWNNKIFDVYREKLNENILSG